MWAAGFSINNLTLMALAVSVGFVVDDAIVMIENMYRNLEQGKRPMEAALEGARQIGFTVVSISVSLIAAFIPLLFMGGVVGRLLREFSRHDGVRDHRIYGRLALGDADDLRAFREGGRSPDATRFDRIVETFLGWLCAATCATLERPRCGIAADAVPAAGHARSTVHLYIVSPKGYFPQDDTGLIFALHAGARRHLVRSDASSCSSQALDIVLADQAVAGVGSSVGAGGFNSRQPGTHVHQPEAAGGARGSHRARDRPPAPGARGHPRAERFHERRRRTSAWAAARAVGYQFTLWGTESTSSTPGRRRSSSG